MLNQQRNEMHDQFSQILPTFKKSPTPKPDTPTFAITARSRTTTHNPTYLTPSNVNDTGMTNEDEGPEGDETTTIPNKETSQSPILYHPSKSSSIHVNLPFLKAMIYMPKGDKFRSTQDKNKSNHLRGRSKPSAAEPPKLELKELPENLEYAFLQGDDQLPVIISSTLPAHENTKLLKVLKIHNGAIAWSIVDIKGIDSSYCTHKILMEDEFKPTIQPQRRVNPNIKEVVKKEVIKLLDAGLIHPISNNPWVSPVQVDREKIESISKLPYPRNTKSIRSFLGHASTEECIQAFNRLKRELTHAPIMIKPEWSLPFEIMCDVSDYAVWAVLRQRKDKHFQPIHYASKTMNEAQENYTMMEKELLAVVFTFDKSSISKFEIKKGTENLVANHLSRLGNSDLGKLTKAEIRDLFPKEQLMTISDQSSEPWYADYANYLASRVLPFQSTRQEKQKFFNDLRHFFWDKPFLFKQCADQIIRRCVSGNEVAQKLRQCHSGPSGGHHGIATTARKLFEALFY
ncbi:reverse transcriptase domain-containing protein [Tanacetum coccineum]